jgi:hypothetical protein
MRWLVALRVTLIARNMGHDPIDNIDLHFLSLSGKSLFLLVNFCKLLLNSALSLLIFKRFVHVLIQSATLLSDSLLNNCFVFHRTDKTR